MNCQARINTEDRIDVSKIEMPKPETLTQVVREITTRFYEQEFTVKHVYACAMDHSKVSSKANSRRAITDAVTQLYRNGEIEIVRRGQRGSVPTVYRNKSAA